MKTINWLKCKDSPDHKWNKKCQNLTETIGTQVKQCPLWVLIRTDIFPRKRTMWALFNKSHVTNISARQGFLKDSFWTWKRKQKENNTKAHCDNKKITFWSYSLKVWILFYWKISYNNTFRTRIMERKFYDLSNTWVTSRSTSIFMWHTARLQKFHYSF